MSEEIKRGPGRPRKTPEEPMENIEVKVTAPEMPKKAPAGDKRFKFKLLKGVCIANPADFMVVEVDEDGNHLDPRNPNDNEYGPNTKILPGTILMLNAWYAKHYRANKIAEHLEDFE
jgi:hypothetical protein